MKPILIVSLILFLNALGYGQVLNPPAPLITTDGDTLTQNSLKGKIVVLNFWFIACLPCRKEIPELNELRQKYMGNKEVKFIAISMIDEADKIKYFISRMPFNYQHVSKNKDWIESYNVGLYPTNIVLNGSWKVVFRKEGYDLSIYKTLDSIIQKHLED